MSFAVFLLKVLRRLKLLSRINFSLTASFGGAIFRIPIVQGIGFDHFFPSENWMDNLLKKLLLIKKGTFVDVGVNIGQTLLVVKGIDPLREYIGFEPNPQCVFYSNILIKKNHLSSIKILPAGIFSFDGVAKLYHDASKVEDSCATLVEDFRDTSKSDFTLVPVISGNSVSSILEADVAILKIDVEGAELDVLEQLLPTISKYRPFIICEILPAYSEANQNRLQRQHKIEILLKSVKYKIAQIHKEIVNIDTIPIEGEPEMANYLFYPAENDIVKSLK